MKKGILLLIAAGSTMLANAQYGLYRSLIVTPKSGMQQLYDEAAQTVMEQRSGSSWAPISKHVQVRSAVADYYQEISDYQYANNQWLISFGTTYDIVTDAQNRVSRVTSSQSYLGNDNQPMVYKVREIGGYDAQNKLVSLVSSMAYPGSPNNFTVIGNYRLHYESNGKRSIDSFNATPPDPGNMIRYLRDANGNVIQATGLTQDSTPDTLYVIYATYDAAAHMLSYRYRNRNETTDEWQDLIAYNYTYAGNALASQEMFNLDGTGTVSHYYETYTYTPAGKIRSVASYGFEPGITKYYRDTFTYDGAGKISAGMRFVSPDGASWESQNSMRYVFSAVPTGIDETLGEAMTLTLYPSPARELLHIHCDQHIRELRISDLSGKTQLIQPGSNTVVNIESLPAGIYLLQLTTDNGYVQVKRFVKE